MMMRYLGLFLALLVQGLSRASPVMIQGDVVAMNHVPVMAPSGSTKLNDPTPLARWIADVSHEIREDPRAGVRLNILYDNATALAISEVGKFTHNFAKGPFWFHADVLKGPNYQYNALEPVSAREFIKAVEKYFSKATISFGWTSYPTWATRIMDDGRLMPAHDTKKHEIGYTWSNYLDMLEIALPRTQSTNIVVKTPFFSNQDVQLAWLLAVKPTLTVTLWLHENDDPSVFRTVAIARECVDRSRVFVDYFGGVSNVSVPSCPPPRWDTHKWEAVNSPDPDIHTSTYGVILLGKPNSALMSRTHLQSSDGNKAPHQQVRGTVHFVAPEDRTTAYPNDTRHIPSFVIHLKDDMTLSTLTPITRSIRVELNAKGRLYIEDGRNDSVPVGSRPRAAADFCQFPCYDFLVNDYHNKVEFKVRLSKLCTGLNRTNQDIAAKTTTVRTLTLPVDNRKTAKPPMSRYKRSKSAEPIDRHRYKRSARAAQADYVLVQGGGEQREGNRIIVERLKHHQLSDSVHGEGFGAAPGIFSGNFLFLSKLCFVWVLVMYLL